MIQIVNSDLWTAVRRVKDTWKATKSLGRKQTRGTKLDNRAALGKAIALCDLCRRKFNAKQYGYKQAPNIPFCRGECDSCGEYNACCTLLQEGKHY